MLTLFMITLLLSNLNSPGVSHAKPAAGVSGTLSLVPGLGQVANGNPWEGLAWFITVIGLIIPNDPGVRQASFDLWMYNMYDAYRDAGPKSRKFKNHTVFENYINAFYPLNIIDPIGAPIVGLGAVAGVRDGYPALRNPAKPFIYGFVGLGEEGLFRGFLFPGFSDLFSSKFLGALTSSALFALVHITNGRQDLRAGVMAQRLLMGMLFCWQVNRNQYDLRNNIFAHAWFDIFVDQAGMIQGLKMNIPF